MKKIFTCLVAMTLSLFWSVSMFAGGLIADEYPTQGAMHAPAAVETVETSTKCVAMADLRSSNKLYQLQIYVDSPENLCFCVAATVSKSSDDFSKGTLTTTNSSIYTYNGLPASASINGTKRCNASAISGSVTQVYGNYYYADVYLTGASSPYNKQYHIKAYFVKPGTSPFSHDSESDELKLALQMSQAATKLTSGNTKYQATYETTINATKYSYTATAIFPGMNKAYIPSGKYPIKNSGTNGTYIKASTANNDLSNSIVELSAGGYFFYWHVMSGEAIAINPNQTSSPMFFQMKFNNTYWGFASYTQLIVQGTAPTKRSLTVSAGAGANGSASITCAEGHGYANSATADFTANGNYYYDGTTVSLVAPAAATGYHFQNWTKNSSQVSTNSTYELGNVSSTNSGAYVANYAANTYSVRFNKNNGTGTMSDEEFTYGDAAKALTANVFQRTGYNFKGWATSVSRADAGTVDYTDQQAVQNLTTENEKVINLYAVWELITYNLTYTGLEGATHSNPATYTIVSETITLSAPSERTGYDFTSWTCGGETITEIAKGSTGDKEIVANWAQKTFAVTIQSNNSEYGTIDVASVANVPYGMVITTDYNKVTINGTTVTATPATATAQYTYAFTGWTLPDNVTTVTEALTITANFTRTTNKYDIVFLDDDNTELQSQNLEYGATITAPVVEDKEDASYTYTFLAWNPDFVNGTTVTGAATYKATYTATPKVTTTFTLEDQHNAGEAYYTTLETLVGSTKDVTYQRTLGGGTADAPCWSTFSLPFDYPLYGNDRTFQDKVVYLDHASYDAGSGILTLNFMYETYKIEANKPYALYNTGSAIVNPVFENVEIVGQTDGSYTVGCTTGGSVTFTNTQTRQKLNANDPNTIYVLGQSLYFPGAATYMRAFSGYFVLNDVYSANIAPRVRVVINEEDATAIMSEEAPAKLETKKYMENGILVIERAGIRYTAQGTCIR